MARGVVHRIVKRPDTRRHVTDEAPDLGPGRRDAARDGQDAPHDGRSEEAIGREVQHHRAPGQDLGHHQVARDAMEQRMVVGAPRAEHPGLAGDLAEDVDELLFVPIGEMDRTVNLLGLEGVRDLPFEGAEIGGRHP